MVNTLIVVGGVLFVVQYGIILILLNKIVRLKPIHESNKNFITSITKKMRELKDFVMAEQAGTTELKDKDKPEGVQKW